LEEKIAKISLAEHRKLKEIKQLYGISIRMLLDKAIAYAYKNRKQAWGIK
jgi:hypothetical protein